MAPPFVDTSYIDRSDLLQIIYRLIGSERHTQDTGILPEVWIEYASVAPEDLVSLILSQEDEGSTGALALCLREQLIRYMHRLPRYRPPLSDRNILSDARITPNRWCVAGDFTLAQFIDVPLEYSVNLFSRSTFPCNLTLYIQLITVDRILL